MTRAALVLLLSLAPALALGDTARIEVPVGQLAEVVARRAEVVEATKAAGYAYVTLDLEGLRSGNLNDAHRLADAQPVRSTSP